MLQEIGGRLGSAAARGHIGGAGQTLGDAVVGHLGAEREVLGTLDPSATASDRRR